MVRVILIVYLFVTYGLSIKKESVINAKYCAKNALFEGKEEIYGQDRFMGE